MLRIAEHMYASGNFRLEKPTRFFFRDGSRTLSMKPCRNPSASSAGPCMPSPSPSRARPMLASMPSLVAACSTAARCTLFSSWAARSRMNAPGAPHHLGPCGMGAGACAWRCGPSRCAGCQTRAPSCACPPTPQPWSRSSNRGVRQQPRADRRPRAAPRSAPRAAPRAARGLGAHN
jgi:hypothetical protein